MQNERAEPAHPLHSKPTAKVSPRVESPGKRFEAIACEPIIV